MENDIENVWKRILEHSLYNNEMPPNGPFFYTQTGIKFWIVKINDITILPQNERNAHLWPITKNHIENDIANGIAGNNQVPVNTFGPPAPSYRWALLNDDRIWY